MKPTLFAVLSALPFASACDRGQCEASDLRPEDSATATSSAPSAVPSALPSANAAAGSSAPSSLAEKLSIDAASVPPAAAADDYVLAPARAALNAALTRDGDLQPIIYYGAWMKQPGRPNSLIATLLGDQEQIPNALIIPIRRSETAAPGDIVLTTWAAGSGMQRGIVVEGGQQNAPRVRYLDLAYDHPTGWGQRADTLRPNTFHRLTRPGQIGTTIACRQGPSHTWWTITGQLGNRVLARGLHGQVKSLDRAHCRDVPLVPQVMPGSRVFVPVQGRYVKARVTKVDARIGRVFAKYRVDAENQKRAFAFTNVALDLE